jgi:hypothetical protein
MPAKTSSALNFSEREAIAGGIQLGPGSVYAGLIILLSPAHRRIFNFFKN